jgi:hypothetical protein
MTDRNSKEVRMGCRVEPGMTAHEKESLQKGYECRNYNEDLKS